MVCIILNLFRNISRCYMCDAISHLKHEDLCVFKKVSDVSVGVKRVETQSSGVGQNSADSDQHEAHGEKFRLGKEGLLPEADTIPCSRTIQQTVPGTLYPLHPEPGELPL